MACVDGSRGASGDAMVGGWPGVASMVSARMTTIRPAIMAMFRARMRQPSAGQRDKRDLRTARDATR